MKCTFLFMFLVWTRCWAVKVECGEASAPMRLRSGRIRAPVLHSGASGWKCPSAEAIASGEQCHWECTATPTPTLSVSLISSSTASRTPDPVPSVSIDYARLQYPCAPITSVSAATTIFSVVYEAGVTNQPEAWADLAAQVGYGPFGSDPSADEDSGDWLWSAATYKGAFEGGDNDEYQGDLTVPEQGLYAFAYRYRVRDGGWWGPWSFVGNHAGPTGCGTGDGTGTSNPFVASEAGQVRVGVTYGHNQFPCSASSEVTWYGRVRHPVAPSAPGDPGDIWAQLGAGPTGTSPSSTPLGVNNVMSMGRGSPVYADAVGWTWWNATFNVDVDEPDDTNDADEFAVTPPTGSLAPGSYTVVWRFSQDNGRTWLYADNGGNTCTGSGTDDGYSDATTATWTVA
eukprot:TRINITY_DN35667_c0_g1_i1.p1 TRINITY_DN35667_c0_g1~~TRINITY_DN35667_c0_g1_i1.p1  ORF type:complete len:399 (-),score=25.85 TRINITY_DN35667_c0_g1_i1:360-1556(-)